VTTHLQHVAAQVLEGLEARVGGAGAPDVAEAIADGRRPSVISEGEIIVCDLSTELHRNKRVSDQTRARVEKRFGKNGVVDLTGIKAYCALLAMQLTVAQCALPKDGKKLVRLPE
jgi:4-carboxymuconolactone decarboxylase